MPDPGEPYGADEPVVVIMNGTAVAMPDQPTDALPWHGDAIAVPAFINGCAVVAAVKLAVRPRPGGPRTDVHRYAVVFVDNGKQGGPAGTLVVALVAFSSAYRIRQKSVGRASYAEAVLEMCSLANIAFERLPADPDLADAEDQQTGKPYTEPDRVPRLNLYDPPSRGQDHQHGYGSER